MDIEPALATPRIPIVQTMKPITTLFVSLVAAIVLTSGHASATDLILSQDGAAKAVICATPDVMAEDRKLAAAAPYSESQAETQRRRLRESVKDLSYYLEKMSEAKFEVRTSAPDASDKRVPILVGSPAVEKFGPVKQKAPYAQGFRVVVAPDGIGLLGESDEATSYAIYELLDRLGCRWYLPSELGEEIPRLKTVALPPMDFAGAPGTWYRGVWYSSEEFQRRNRLGGFPIATGQVMENYVTKAQREEHPDWRAVIKGQPSATRLKWSHPGVQQAVADAVIVSLDKHYQPSISLSPEDGVDFDESDDKAWDAGDFDPVMDTASITDRFVKFANIVAEKVVKKYPDVKLGFLAYVQFFQAPVREKLHPNLVPQLAPINYCRAHAMTDACLSRQHVKTALEAWSKASPSLSYYNFMYNLAEISAPYPMMHQMSEELPLLYANKVKYWQPEGTPDNDAILPGHYLSLRLAWDPGQKPQAVLDEFFHRFYGSAEAPMRRYWQQWDDAWTKVDEHAGGGFSYVRRFTPEVMKAARATMDEALRAANTVTEYRRVKMQDDALVQFERFMQLRWDLNEGRLANLGPLSLKWMASQLHLGDEYEKQFAFDKVSWAPETGAGRWFKSFFQPSYLDGTRIAKECTVITPPLRQWKYAVDKDKAGEGQNWQGADYKDADWKSTDVGVETWSTLGIENYYGPVWYRSAVKVPAVPKDKKVFLWVSSADGDVKVFVNGQLAPYLGEKGVTQEESKGSYCKPLSFDITAAIKPNASNLVSIRGTRVFINELGTGGLLGPVYLYREK